MGNAITITRSEDESKGRFEARFVGRDGIGEHTYSRLSATKIIADHTGVDDSLRGAGVGVALVDRLIADARAERFTVFPLCPFVRAQYKSHPEWSEVMQP